jgi:hypothetical protein
MKISCGLKNVGIVIVMIQYKYPTKNIVNFVVWVMNKLVRSTGGMMLRGESRSTGTAACPSLTWSTESKTQTGLGSKPGLRGDRTPPNRLSHRTAAASVYTKQFRREFVQEWRTTDWEVACGLTLAGNLFGMRRELLAAGFIDMLWTKWRFAATCVCLHIFALLRTSQKHRPKHLSTNVDCDWNQIAVLCTRRSSRSCVKRKELFSWEAEGVTVCTEHHHITSTLNTLRADILGARIPAGVRYFCLLQNAQTSSGIYPAFYWRGAGILSQG